MKTTFLVNPYAGRGRAAELAQQLPERLAGSLDAEVVTTAGPRDAILRAREAAEAGAELIVAVGGDGTAHEVVNGIAETNATFGLIPYGSGNDLALALGIPNDVDAAIEVLRSGRDTRMDLARFNDGWIANSLGLGFEAQVTIESRKVKWLRGFAIYLWAVVRALSGLKCPHLEVRVDDRSFDGRRLLLCIGNGPRVGGGFFLTPDAHNRDGTLDVCLVDGMGRLPVMQTLPKAISGTHTTDPRVTMTRGTKLEIRSNDGFPFHVDGEVYATDCRELTVELHPRKLRVRVPADSTDDPPARG